MNASSVVLDFLTATTTALDALKRILTSVERVGRPGVLAGKTADGEYIREGVLPGVGMFTLHGMGCLVEFDNGTLVDFDWSAQGFAIFDAWRVRKFCRSRGECDLDNATIEHACQDLVVGGQLVEESRGWFRLP